MKSKIGVQMINLFKNTSTRAWVPGPGEAVGPWIRVSLAPGPGEAVGPWIRVSLAPGPGEAVGPWIRVSLGPGSGGSATQPEAGLMAGECSTSGEGLSHLHCRHRLPSGTRDPGFPPAAGRHLGTGIPSSRQQAPRTQASLAALPSSGRTSRRTSGQISILRFYYYRLEARCTKFVHGGGSPSAWPAPSPIRDPLDMPLSIRDRWLLTTHLPYCLITPTPPPACLIAPKCSPASLITSNHLCLSPIPGAQDFLIRLAAGTQDPGWLHPGRPQPQGMTRQSCSCCCCCKGRAKAQASREWWLLLQRPGRGSGSRGGWQWQQQWHDGGVAFP
ncbi:hypothetical protein QTO34_014265 [Cnephaeus nilssonii]|uniref:Uncharacterized protein n=1 Tax=Cnephaeus nilssonii TaxID=3371016 RepID=A0AA40LTV6_CNENI|nr:hypothetical protein QTO34_014265 [Eptesicus nilssonii]